MPDETVIVKEPPAQTDPTAKGTSTSEYKFAALVAVAAGLIGGLESAALILKDAFPHAWWVPLVSGLLGMVGAAFAYLKSRSTVKVAMLQSGTALAVSQQQQQQAIVTKQNPL